MIEIKTADQIEADMLNEMSKKYEKSDGFLTRSIIKSESIELSEIHQLANNIVKMFNVDNLEGEELEAVVRDRTGITRKTATKAKVELTITGNATITVGDMFSTSNNIIFTSTEAKVIMASGTIIAECSEYGILGMVGAESITQMPVTITGVETITNSEPSHDGFEAESDEALRERYYIFLRTPATSGNIYHYQLWASQVTGVGRSRVFPLWNGPNTVEVVVIDSNMQPASSDVVNAVQTYIDPLENQGAGYGQAPIGAYCTVTPATAVNIDINVDVDLMEGIELIDVQPEIETKISEHLKEIAFQKNYVSYAMIGAKILEVEGVLDYQNLTLNSLVASNIPIGNHEVAVLNSVVIT